MASPEDLTQLLRDALANYYDPVRLQSHPLAQALGLQRAPGETIAEALRRCLREGIDRLRPPNAAPHDGPEWLGHRVLLLHYLRSQSPADICRELNISEATLYRRQREALQALTSVMWNAHCAAGSEGKAAGESSTSREVRDRAIALASRLPSQAVPLDELLEGIHQTIAPLAEQQHVALRMAVPPLPATYGEPAILRQAVLALLTECVCAARGGSVELTVRPEDDRIRGTIEVQSGLSGAAAGLAQGQGIRLGAELLRMYGGDAWSEVRGASRAEVCFAVTTLTPISVLIIDDDRATVELYTRYLRGAQYVVTHAYTAEEAEAAVERSLPDVILLDVLLPRRDGWLILETLKSRPATAHIPVLVCSVIEQPELALALGAVRVLTKPITSEQLLQAVQEQTSRQGNRGIGRRSGPAGA